MFTCYNPACAIYDCFVPFIIYYMIVEDIKGTSDEPDPIERSKKILVECKREVLSNIISDQQLMDDFGWDKLSLKKCIETQLLLKLYLYIHGLKVKQLSTVANLDYDPVKLAFSYRKGHKQIGKMKFMSVMTRLYFACNKLIMELKKLIDQESIDRLVDLKINN